MLSRKILPGFFFFLIIIYLDVFPFMKRNEISRNVVMDKIKLHSFFFERLIRKQNKISLILSMSLGVRKGKKIECINGERKVKKEEE